MGAKTWMLVYSDEDASEKLRQGITLDKSRTNELVTTLFPDEILEPITDGDLSFTNPPSDIIYAGYFNGVAVVAANEFAGDYPSKINPRFITASFGNNIYLHAMHSVVDWLAFAKWENGELIRSLSLSPDSGIIEDLGQRFQFEKDFWNGKYPAGDPDDDEDDYPLVFHPLEMGEAVLKAFFGYQLEGSIDESLFDPEEILLCGYRRRKIKPWWKFW